MDRQIRSRKRSSDFDAVVIGGGFFGCKLALYLKEEFDRVLILERELDLLQRASYANQARVHNGYHYPRSLLTALRSRANFPRFVREYRECIDSSFEKYYAISKLFSKVNVRQFELFCQRVGIPLKPAPPQVQKLFNSQAIEGVFQTQEYAFDSTKLKKRIWQDLTKAEIKVGLNSQAIRVRESHDQNISVYYLSKNNIKKIKTKYVFNCTYASLDQILKQSNLPTVPLKYELAEMALVEVPPLLKNKGITVMCGPFFSLMPFPPRGLHTLSHVRYTPHYYWQETADLSVRSHEAYSQISRKTNYPFAIRDAARYLPIVRDCQYVDSLWEVKTVLPQSETDDSRPILFQQNPKLTNFYSVLGGKIDNIYDLAHELDTLLNKQELEVDGDRRLFRVSRGSSKR
ncbi:MAG TPA: FAD-dependent oxidoreductase [Oscillatoriales cyanobacterium M59_W2019_021]|nr:MAG: FAD-binding oxidoreductase [Cyanobacteria bacterium J055]HIK53390.1 FAD-dependent oxidoreductase [Oscillatoriales cyanobacterium M59_W2019_021]